MTAMTNQQIAPGEAKHTATPWRICEHGNESDRICIEVVGGGWFLELTPGYLLSEFPDPVSVGAEFEANAAFIVRAVNAHDELVAALKEAEPFIRSGDVDSRGGKIELSRLANVMAAAIAKAEGR